MGNREKRNYIRLDSLNLLDYLVIDREGRQTTHSESRTLDVSEHGMKLEVTQALNVGDTLIITVGLEDELVDVIGEVKHCEEKDNRYTIGMEFSEISPEAMLIVQRYVKAFNKHFT
jgi:c-di-GMP-binding flagellar brake protein YcgR